MSFTPKYPGLPPPYNSGVQGNNPGSNSKNSSRNPSPKSFVYSPQQEVQQFNNNVSTTTPRGNNPEYHNQIEFPFVPSQMPANVKKLLEQISIKNNLHGNRKNSSPVESLNRKSTSPQLLMATPVRPPPPPYPQGSRPPPPSYPGDSKILSQGPPPLPPKKKGDVVKTPPSPCPQGPPKSIHQSPIPMRKYHGDPEEYHEDKEAEDNLETSSQESSVSRGGGREGGSSMVTYYSSQAYKFFIEQHIENVIKCHQERIHRRLQLEAEMSKIGLSDEAQDQMRRMLSQKESNYIRLKRAKMNPKMFKKIQTIGIGAFGEVALVRKSDTGHLYAMKTLRKSDVLKRNQVAHVKAERDILAEADNEWVVKLYYSFQDNESLYFVMDFIPGGDLMSLLIKKGIFEEPLAQFMIAELCCAIESVHKMGFIHRDIKPDNVLIDRDGHIKLTDFGLCTGFRWTHNSKYYNSKDSKETPDLNDIRPSSFLNHRRNNHRNLLFSKSNHRNQNQRFLAHSLVGTPNYIAPEVLLRTGYTQLCDWWSLGVILYEMLVGQPPFLAPSPAETQLKVINWKETLKIPFYNCCGNCDSPQLLCSQCQEGNISKEARDLILRLCCGHDERLGKTNGANAIKAHEFFQRGPGINFDVGLRKSYGNPPYIPTILHPADTSNFDCIETDEEEFNCNGLENPLEIMETLKTGEDSVFSDHHGFFEFTFRRFFDDETCKNNNNHSNEDGDKKSRNSFAYYKKLFEMSGKKLDGETNESHNHNSNKPNAPVYV